jgi:hypothetical protein
MLNCLTNFLTSSSDRALSQAVIRRPISADARVSSQASQCWNFDGQSDFEFHESFHRDTLMKVTNNMQIYRLIYFSLLALHVSGDVFAHHQENLTVFTVSGSIHPSCYQLVTWMS